MRLSKNSYFDALKMALVVICAFGLPWVSDVQAQDAVLKPDGPLYEVSFNDVPISVTSTLIGAVLGEPATPFNGSLRVWVGEGVSNQLCVSVTSQDGRYEARQSFEVIPGVSGSAVARLAIQKSEFLRRYSAGDMAVVATYGKNCPPLTTELTVAPISWPSASGDWNVLNLFVNAGRNSLQAWVETSLDGVLEPVNCVTVKGNLPRTAFSHVCRIEKKLINKSNFIYVDLMSFGKLVHTTKIKIVSP